MAAGGEDYGFGTDSLTQACFLMRRCAPLEGDAAALEAASRGVAAPHAMLTRHGHGGSGGAAGASANAAPSPAPGGAAGHAPDGLQLSEAAGDAALPRALRGEPEAAGVERHKAFVACAEAMDGCAATVLADANAQPFQRLHAFVTEAYAEDGALSSAVLAPGAFGVNAAFGAGGAAPLPAALVLAGGVNAADHAETFAQLAAHLRQAGCHAALLRSGDIGVRAAGAPAPPGLCATLRCALAQLAGGEPPEAPTLRHLAAWYAVAPAPRAVGDACGDDEDSGEEDDAPQAPPQDAAARFARRRSSLGASAARRVPIALLIEDTECCAGDSLADLIVALSEAGGSLPVVLLLGVATSAAMLQALLPARAAARLRARAFSLWPPVQRLEALQRGVLLRAGTVPLLGASPAALLHERFLKHDFSCTGVRAALRCAALLHFSTQPLAALALPARRMHEADADWAAAQAASLEGGPRDSAGRDELRAAERAAAARASAEWQALRAACEALHPSLLLYARHHVGAVKGAAHTETPGRLAAALRAFGPAAAAWAAALQCIADAAEATAAAAQAALGLRELYRDASAPGFVTGDGAAALQRLQKRVGRLPDDQLAELTRRWAKHLRCVRWMAATGGDGPSDGAAPYDDMRRRAARVSVALRKKHAAKEEHAAKEADAARMPPPPPMSQPVPASPARATPRRASGAGAVLPGGGATPGSGGFAARLGLASTGAAAGGATVIDRKSMRSLLTARANASAAPGSAGGPRGGASGGASGSGQAPCEARKRAVDLFADLCSGPLAKPPQSLACAEVLLFADEKGLLSGYLQAAPRPTLEAALLRPAHPHFLGCACCPAAPGAPPTRAMPDAGAAYAILCAAGAEFVNVHDWFQDFVALHVDADKPPGATSRKRKGAAAEKASNAVAKERLWALQARFTRALAELQTLGFIRPAKRKRGEHVQRLVWGAAEGL
jgi:origin recognition complex subunit 3